MATVFNTKTYTANQYYGTYVIYVGPAKTASVKDDLRLAMTPAKASSVYSGNSRVEAKMTRTHTLTGALTPTGESIFRIEASLPVGIAAGDITTLKADMAAFVGATDFGTLLSNGKIAY